MNPPTPRDIAVSTYYRTLEQLLRFIAVFLFFLILRRVSENKAAVMPPFRVKTSCGLPRIKKQRNGLPRVPRSICLSRAYNALELAQAAVLSRSRVRLRVAGIFWFFSAAAVELLSRVLKTKQR